MARITCTVSAHDRLSVGTGDRHRRLRVGLCNRLGFVLGIEMKTTLNAIRECSPCQEGWAKLLKHLGKTKADDAPLGIATILDSNGLDDALWCLRAVTGHDREIRLFAVRCARQVQHLMADPRSIAALDVAERFANGEATKTELDAASDAARAAAWDAQSNELRRICLEIESGAEA